MPKSPVAALPPAGTTQPEPGGPAPGGAARTTAVGLQALDVRLLPVGALTPNPWNPNRVDTRTFAKMKAYIQREGFVKPLVVRLHPDDAERYQIIDGEHRWKLATQLGLGEVPCVVLDVPDARAKMLTVNLNELGGQPAPDLLAELVHDLSRTTTLADLETLMPFSERELQDHLALLKLPAGLVLELEEEAAAHEGGAPKVITFVVEEASVVEDAIEHVVGTLEGRNRRGRALVAVCRAWLDAHPERSAAPPAAP